MGWFKMDEIEKINIVPHCKWILRKVQGIINKQT